MLRPAVGDSLFTSEGNSWRWQRRAVAPVFAQRNVTALAPMMTATAERATEQLMRGSEHAELQEKCCQPPLMSSARWPCRDASTLMPRPTGHAILRYFETAGKASVLDFLGCRTRIPRPGALLGLGPVRTMHRMVAQAIDARRQQASRRRDDLLDHMLKAEDPVTGRRMSPTDLLHNMQFFIVAGHETTALALSWSLLLLALYPKAQERAHEEAARLSQTARGAEHMEAMPYVKQVIEEAMRLYPPVGMLARNVRGPIFSVGGNPAQRLAVPSDLCSPSASACGGSARTNLIRRGSHRRRYALAIVLFICLLAQVRAFASAQIRNDAGSHHPSYPSCALPLRSGDNPCRCRRCL